MTHYDLIVAGGGFSGVGAALAAARNGLKVLLIERGNCLGGAAAVGLINPFMPYWTPLNGKNDSSRKKLSAGIFKEISDNLAKAGALASNDMTFDEEYLKLLLNRMMKQAGVNLLYHSYVTDAEINDGKINFITVANKSGNTKFTADYYIDSTGDGDVATICGFPFMLGREKDGLSQPMTLCFRLAGVDREGFNNIRPSINPLYKEFREQGKIKNIREDVLIFNTMKDDILHFNSTRIVKKNPVDAFDITDAEIDAREQVHELVAFLKDNFECFKNAHLIMTAPQIGVRESRKIEGEYLLTADDIKECIKFDDAIAAGNYDIDIHNPEGSGTFHYYFPDGEYYTIPYRSLIPKGSKNLLTAGRCISATHEAQASIRIIPIVCCIGEAAGTAVAVAFKNKTELKSADINEIQEILRKNGAFLGI